MAAQRTPLKLRTGGEQTLFRKGSVKALIFEGLQKGMIEDDIVSEIIEKFGKTKEEADREIKVVKTAKIR
jgi:hypothetical protein